MHSKHGEGMMGFRKRQRKFSCLQRYALAFVIFLSALALRLILLPVELGVAFLTFYPAMVLTFSLCGVGPGIFFTVFSTLTGYFIFFTPFYSFEHNLAGEIATITYLISAVLIAKIIGQLRNTTTYLHDLLDHSPAGIVTIDPVSGQLTSANPAALTMWGYSEDEIQTKTSADLTPLDEQEVSRQRNQTLFNGEVDSLHFEKRYIRNDGSTFWAETYASAIKDTNGKVKMFVGNSTDITDRKRLESQITELNRDFVTFLENTSDFIYFKDQDSRFRFCSQTLANITGHRSWRDMIGKHDLEVFPEESAKIYCEEELPIFRDGVALLNQIDPYYDASGNKCWVSTNKWPIFNDSGRVIGLFGISHDISAFKNLQESLQLSETRYRSLLDDQTELICRFKADGTIMYVNDAYCRFFGVSKNDVLETTWHPVVYHADLPYIYQQLATLTVDHDVVTIENRVFAANAELRWGQFVNRAFFDEQSQLIEIQAVGRDITDRKQLELAVNTENEKNQVLLRNASDGIHILDQDGNILEVSDSFCSMLGYSREELLGMNVTQWDAGFLTVDETMAALKQQLESSNRCQFETRHRRKDGSIFEVEVSGKALILADKLVIFNSSRDITDRKQLAEKLVESTKEIADLYEHAPCGYHSIGPDGKFLYINATELAWLGCSREEVIGKMTPYDFFTAEGQALFEKSFPEFLKNGYLNDLEFEIVSHGGPPRFTSLNATAIVDDDGKFLMSRSILFDITQTKQSQDALRASEQRFRTMANSAPVLIWIAGLDKACFWFNKVWLDFTGRSLEQEMGNG
jgi:PAS domain S-box-containing protein